MTPQRIYYCWNCWSVHRHRSILSWKYLLLLTYCHLFFMKIYCIFDLIVLSPAFALSVDVRCVVRGPLTHLRRADEAWTALTHTQTCALANTKWTGIPSRAIEHTGFESNRGGFSEWFILYLEKWFSEMNGLCARYCLVGHTDWWSDVRVLCCAVVGT